MSNIDQRSDLRFFRESLHDAPAPRGSADEAPAPIGSPDEAPPRDGLLKRLRRLIRKVFTVDTTLKIIAMVATLAYFSYQIAAGSLVPTTSLSLKVTPTEIDNKTWGVVTINIERGDNWSVVVKRAELTVVEGASRAKAITINYKHPERATFELGPKEKTQYGAIVELPAGKSALIEALFVTQQKNCGLDIFCTESFVFGSVEVPPVAKNGAPPVAKSD